MDTQPIIEFFNLGKSWPNSKCEYTHLVQDNQLFSERYTPKNSKVWMNPYRFSK